MVERVVKGPDSGVSRVFECSLCSYWLWDIRPVIHRLWASVAFSAKWGFAVPIMLIGRQEPRGGLPVLSLGVEPGVPGLASVLIG